MNIHVRPIGPFQVNCYVLTDDTDKTFAVIDAPGWDPLFDMMLGKGYTPVWIALTHGHIDHISGLKSIREKLDCPVYLHPDDRPMLKQVDSSPFKAMLGAETPPEPEHDLYEETRLIIGDTILRPIHTPGHTRGGVCLYDGNEILFSGDTLFLESIGRTDLPGGSMHVLMNSIRNNLWPLPDQTRVLPGHGPETTIGHEKNVNPFVRQEGKP